MTMTNEEICREYRLAKQPAKQIDVLADLNQCPKKVIVEILRQAGEKLPGNYYKAPKKPAAPAEEKPAEQNTRAAALRKMIVSTFGRDEAGLLETALMMYEEALKC